MNEGVIVNARDSQRTTARLRSEVAYYARVLATSRRVDRRLRATRRIEQLHSELLRRTSPARTVSQED